MSTSALRSRNFVLLIAGQAISLIASTTLRFALSMWVLDETGSATTFATILSLSFIPTLLLSPFGGVLADRLDRKAIMVGLDAANAAFVAVATAAFIALGIAKTDATTSFTLGYSTQIVAALLIFLSILSAFETPTVQAVLPQLLKEHGETVLRQGSGITMQVQQLCSLIPTMIGGVLYAFVGAAPMFGISIAGFVLAAAVETRLQLGAVGDERNLETVHNTRKVQETHELQKPQDLQRLQKTQQLHSSQHTRGSQQTKLPNIHPLADIREALLYLIQQKPYLLHLMLFSTFFNLLIMGYSAIGLPYLIRTKLALNSIFFGINEGLASLFGLIGALLASKLATKLSMKQMPLMLYIIASALGIVGIAFMSTLSLSNTAIYAVIVGTTCIATTTCSFTNIIAIPAIQLHTSEALTGRVMSLLASLSIAAQPVGQLLYGWMFDNVHASWVILGSSAALAIAGLAASPLCKSSIWDAA